MHPIKPFVMVVALTVSASASAQQTFFGVGNSHTIDARLGRSGSHLTQLGLPNVQFSSHIRASTSLTQHLADPSSYIPAYSTAVSANGFTGGLSFSSALPNHRWDYISLQPFRETLSEAVNAVDTLVNLARQRPDNHQSMVLIYSSWPQADANRVIDFPSSWLSQYDPLVSSTMWTRDYAESLMLELTTQRPDVDFRAVPVGDVLLEIDRRAKLGQMPSIGSAGDLYRDSFHMNNVGRFVANLTFVAVMSGSNPANVVATASDFVNVSASNFDVPLTLDLQQAIQSAVWDVVRTHPYTQIPEPTTLALVIGASVALLRRR